MNTFDTLSAATLPCSDLNTRPRHLAVAVAVALACLVNGNTAHALPTGAQIAAGTATINQSGNVLNINNSDRAILNWQQFNIGANETVRFNQPTVSSSILNRVLGNDPSQLLGQLQSNGRVWLINPAGILVGPGARIDTAGFVASTLNVRNEDFLAGKLNFQNTAGAGNLTNRGTISTPEGGSVYLVAPDVKNEGIINTPKGETLLAAGQTVELIDTATPGVSVAVTGATGNVTNLGQVVADAGRVGMVGVLVRNSGTLDTHSVVSEGGRIFLKAKQDTYVEQQAKLDASGSTGGRVEVLGQQVALADQAQINASGTQGGGTVLIGGDRQGRNPEVQNARAVYIGPNTVIQADALQMGDGGKVIVWSDEATRAHGAISAQGSATGKGGFVETSGGWLNVEGSRVKAGKGGEWLLDPYDVVITTTATSNNTGNPSFTPTAASSVINNNEISTALSSGNVTIDTTGAGGESGDITINEPITKGAGGDATLTLKAHRNITVNANGAISSTTGKLNLALQADQDGNGSGTIYVDQTINTNAGDFTASGNTITLNSTVTATGGLVWLYPSVANNGMTIVTAKTGGFELDATDMSNVTAGTLRIGDMNSGALAINASLSPNNVNKLSLRSGSMILQSSPITATHLAVQALGDVTLDHASNDVDDLAANIGNASNQNKNFRFTNSTPLQVAASLDSIAGIQINTNGTFNSGSADGVISLISTGGALTQDVGATLGGKAVYAEGSKVTLTENNPTGVLAGKATGGSTGDIFSYKSSNPILLSTVSGKSGVAVTNNSLDTYTVELKAGSGGIGQEAGALIAPTAGKGLKVETTGPVNLPLTTNAFGQFATTVATGLIDIKAANNLTLGSTSGDTVSTNSNAAVKAEITTGNIVVAGNINAGSGDINLNAPNLQIGVGAYPGVTLTGGDIKLDAKSAAGQISTFGTTASTLNSSSYLRLRADGFSFSPAPTFSASTAIYYRTYSDNRSITVGNSCNGLDPVCLVVGGMTQSAPNIVIGNHTAADSDTTGNLHVDAAISNAGGRVFLLSGGTIDQTAAITANGLGAVAESNIALVGGTTNAVNNFAAKSATGVINLTNGQNLTINSIAALDAMPAITGVQTTGVVDIHATGTGNLTLTSPVNAGTALILDALGSFTNNAGINGITVSSGRWLVYSQTPDNIIKGGLTSNFRKYGQTYATYPNPVEANNGFIYANAASNAATINTSLASGSASHTYGNTPSAVFKWNVASGANLDPEDITGTASYTPTISSGTAAGSYSVVYSSGLNSGLATLSPGSGLSYTVTPAAIVLQTVSAGLTGTTEKVYDATTTATLTPANFILSGFVNGDGATVTKTTGTYANKNAGTSILVSTTLNQSDFSPTGSTSFANYTLPTSASGNIGKITPVSLQATGITAQDKVYDAKTTATINTANATLSGLISGDNVQLLSGSGQFADKNVGKSKPVTATFSLSGADAANYTLTSPGDLAASITPAPITQITGVTAQDKIYDGTTAAQINSANAQMAGAMPGDDITLTSVTGRFADKNVGQNKTVVADKLVLAGADVANYQYDSNTSLSTTANITPATISQVSGLGVKNKVYDGTTQATLDMSNAHFDGQVAGDTLSLAGAQLAFADKNVGGNKPVSVTGLTLGGADAGNYQLASTSLSTAASITPAPLKLAGSITARDKVYDATTKADVDFSGARLEGALGSDELKFSAQGAHFADKNVGKNKPVLMDGVTLSGADVGNYQYDSSSSPVTASITPASITQITGITARDKVYDATTQATIDLAKVNIQGKLAGDDLTVASSKAQFADKNVGQNKPVRLDGITLAGADAGNYDASAAVGSLGNVSTTANITPAPITQITGITAQDKVYDATPRATLDLDKATLQGKLVGDELTLASAAGHFSDKNAGKGKTVTIDGMKLGGSDAGNYQYEGAAPTTTASISPVVIPQIDGIIAKSKSSDGSTTAELDTRNAQIAGLLSGDDLHITGAEGAFQDDRAGLDKPVKISGITLSGADAGNYVLANPTATTFAHIKPLIDTLIATDSAQNKIDQAVSAVITLAANSPNAPNAMGAPGADANGGNAGQARPFGASSRGAARANTHRSDKDEDDKNADGTGNARNGTDHRPVAKKIPMCS